ncbi:MAG TPA: hypothetical protein VFH27_07200 [Longimicrobiaceae bacterium]|nr:hypothetical protein [Longimicrobiaceae bacterium]
MASTFRTLAVAAALVGAAAAPAQAQAWRDSLRTRITTEFPTTRVASDMMRVTQPGAVLVLQKDGISAKPGTGGLMVNSHYTDGAIIQPRGLGGFFAGSAETMRQLKAGEKVYLTDVAVGDNQILLRMLTSDVSSIAVAGNTRQTRYTGTVTVDFPRGYLATASADSVMAKLGELVKTEAAASAPASIGLGQTPAQVEAALGRPNSVINLGAKVIYVYASMKVIFQDGKVADVQ